jgi:IS30 family transposase
MAKLPKLAAALSEQDTRLSEVLRLSLVEGLSIRAIAKRLKLSRKTVRRLLARGPERQPPSSEPRPSLLDTYDADCSRTRPSSRRRASSSGSGRAGTPAVSRSCATA